MATGAFGSDAGRCEFNGYALRFIATLLYIILAMAVASSASSGVTSERGEDTRLRPGLQHRWTDGEISRGQKCSGRSGASVIFWGCWYCIGSSRPVACRLDPPVELKAVSVETVVYLWFAIALGYLLLVERPSPRPRVGRQRSGRR